MERRRFGNTDMHVSRLGFGGSEIGFEGTKDADALLNAALDSGINVIDSAAAYLESEALIGAAIGHRRSEYFLFTKCGALDGFSRSDWSRAGIRQAIESSLKALRTDHVDLIQLHSCSAAVLKKGEAVEALQQAKRDGLARYIGYSGDGENAAFAVEMGVFDALQTSVNIADQQCLTLTLPKARARNMGVIAKRPIANAAWRTGSLPPIRNASRKTSKRSQRGLLMHPPWIPSRLASVKWEAPGTARSSVHLTTCCSPRSGRWWLYAVLSLRLR